MPSSFRSTAVVGAGAVGCFFGAMLARAGHRVTLVGRPRLVEAIGAQGGVRLAMGGRTETIPIEAGDSIAAVRDADLVLVCVKSTDTDATARSLAPHLAAGAVVMSLQNGVDNAATIARQVPGARVVPAVVYVATAMPEAGLVAHHGRGDLVIGNVTGQSRGDEPPLESIVAHFASAGVPVRLSADVMAELWAKLLVNCAYNAASGLAQANYGTLAASPDMRALQETVVREVVAVANADGVALGLDASFAAVRGIAAAMAGQLSSTAQDMARGKPSEIDHLNGFVVRRGAALGVPTPANQALHALVKLVEAARR